jgi:hypothetical protein
LYVDISFEKAPIIYCRRLPIDVGWGGHAGLWLDVEDGRPVIYAVVEQGVSHDLVLSFIALPDSFWFLLCDQSFLPSVVDENEIHFRKVTEIFDEEKTPPHRLFYADMNDEFRFFPTYNWLRRLLRKGSCWMRFIVVRTVEDPENP